MKFSRNTKTFRHLLKRLKTLNNPNHHPHIKLASYTYNISKQLDDYKTKTNRQIKHLHKTIGSKRCRHTKKRRNKRRSRRRRRY